MLIYNKHIFFTVELRKWSAEYVDKSIGEITEEKSVRHKRSSTFGSCNIAEDVSSRPVGFSLAEH